MPVRELGPRLPNPQTAALVDRLVEEWRRPAEGAGRPEIYIERRGGFRPVHLYVVWDEWGSLGQRERSEAILEAFERARGRDEALEVSVAMGLTQQESQRLGIPLRAGA